MGGGDLNSKKSWHPNTMKNQERVWKAEQAAAEEKKRIVELQKERAEEHDHEELNALSRKRTTVSMQESDTRLNWMYDKPDKKVQAEDYLLGKSVDASFDGPAQTDKDVIPAVSRRVAGVSMVVAGASSDTQVDLVRKLREDPLLLVKERERAARAALLNNPLHRRRLTELLRQDQEKRKEKKSKKSKNKDKSIDNLLAAKLNALGQGGVDLAALLGSDDSSSDSSSDSASNKKRIKKKKKKKMNEEKSKKSVKKSKKKKKQHAEKYHSDINSSEGTNSKHRKKKNSTRVHYKVTANEQHYSRDRSTDCPERYKEASQKDSKQKHDRKRQKSVSPDDVQVHKLSNKRKKHYRSRDRSSSSEVRDSRYQNRTKTDTDVKTSTSSYERTRSRERRNDSGQKKGRSGGLSEGERAARLAEMVRAGAEREVGRGRRVAAQRAEEEREGRCGGAGPGLTLAHGLPTSLESRIHSNRHYIQRDKRHMNEHFARR